MNLVLIITLLLAPAYALRFSLLGESANLLMLWVFLVWVVFGFTHIWTGEWKQCLKLFKLQLTNWKLLFQGGAWKVLNVQSIVWLLAGGFLLAGVVSLFVGGYSKEKLAQFLVLVVQPISIFVITRHSLQKTENRKQVEHFLFIACYFLLFASGLYAVLQYFTLLGVPPEWWGNSTEPKRALAFFLHPNFFALFITPLLAYTLPSVMKPKILNANTETLNKSEVQNPNIKSKWLKVKAGWLPAFAWILGALGLLLSMSRGGWLGLATATGIFILLQRSKKLYLTAVVTALVLVTVVFSIPNFRYRILLPFQGEKSAVSRLSLIQTGWKEIKASPVLGHGLLGFSRNWAKYNSDLGLSHHPTPHNLYVALWVDFGFLGLVSFIGLCTWGLFQGFRKQRTLVQFGVALALVAMLTHGLVDTPYLKNDLALVFWLLLALI